MRRSRSGKTRAWLVFVVAACGVGLGLHALSAQAPPAGLHIVIIEGEDAVNIIQQKTAVAPIVEVRDRNDQPVAGALVNFAIRSGRATFGGARTLSITTNAAGRAVAAGFAPTGSGALQISATAAFQGQTAAAVTIAQTTVQTAAQAAAVGASSAGGTSGGASTGASAGAGGGGLSGTTIGIVGAAAAAGTVVAVKEISGSGTSGTTYRGQFSGTLPMTFPQPRPCTRNETHDGTLDMDISESNGTVSGTAHAESKIVVTPGTCDPTAAPNNSTDGFLRNSATVNGTAANVTFNDSTSNNFPASGGSAAGVNSYTLSFTGSLSGGAITGTLTMHREIGGPLGAAGNGTGTVVFNVTLR
jgi:hypothetical protein